MHRDLKPSNILVDPAGRVRLLDFGIAKLLDPASLPGAMPLTRTAYRSMTPEYTAPEQVAGNAITTATDVYQLGVLLCELLTGERPGRAAGRARTLRGDLEVANALQNLGVMLVLAGEPEEALAALQQASEVYVLAGTCGMPSRC